MRGHPLIEVENLISLGAAGRSMARQMLKATPLALVRCNESVQIHAHTVFAVTSGRRGRPRTLNQTCQQVPAERQDEQHSMSDGTMGDTSMSDGTMGSTSMRG